MIQNWFKGQGNGDVEEVAAKNEQVVDEVAEDEHVDNNSKSNEASVREENLNDDVEEAVVTNEQEENEVVEDEHVDKESNEASVREENLHPLEESEQKEPFFTRENIRLMCYPHGLTLQAIPLSLCLVALILSLAASYSCTFFKGASISWIGGNYGLWSLEDNTGKCQLWDVLFFAYDLGPPLTWARIFSMTCMLLGLALFTAMTQALQFHAVSWGLGVCFAVLLIVSISTTSIYNMWIVFWGFTYVIYILIVRLLFIHPVHRRISVRGCRIIAIFLLICALSALLTLVVLKSDFCTCKNITADKLEGRSPGDPCNSQCKLGGAGYVMIVASIFWIASAWAVMRFGIQPAQLVESKAFSAELYAHYPRDSIGARIEGLVQGSEALQQDQDDATVDRRTCCQKICCDFRVVPRDRKEQCGFWCFRVMLGALVGIYVFICVVKIGSRIENTQAAQSPDTSYNFITDTVCALNPLAPFEPFQSFDSKEDSANAGLSVAHCGACGVCSNVNDIRIYIETRKTIAKSSKQCGVKAVFGSYSDLVKCLEGKIGFSRDCTMCWADNMLNTLRNCIFTCMTTMMTGFMKSNNVRGAGDRGWLNQCLFCDEKRSGPEFVTCSGPARRRLGIVSEIERNPAEQCNKTDFDWVDVDFDTVFPGSGQ